MTANVTKNEIIDIKGIMNKIPHRYPLLLVDRILSFEKGKSAVGLKNVTINEPFFQGHFPAAPVMPGVLIVESMAQTAGVLVVHTMGVEGEGKLVYFMTIDNAKFRRPVTPGDSIHVHIHVIKSRGPVWKFKGEAMVDGQLCAEAEFSAMIIDPETV
ncbi:MAG: 3-hydroxyacyl-ACP dehydratase FabZ [Alphaproteobacteria bacterium]|jgi:3-hydroxyacyl-[acyl-carrier-protein] dehydratase|nr:3-hydroxyacyl-ACP dehydratase FabZ [Alphaproteobacteria bacterium]MCB1550953.1 3-hydroxyacyl-ACP dehydratase FabZ [Alphaproteobacteria bacterium]MCB9984868.1 3-hydroxyacyl-ACP dehydratase FabZ [Micavibrio sp.]HPQ51334.1 3-hydroxyacyl-ACP dehydratase FabZ [Alphaproteobacteria bacterium]HRK97260.1 3-hydroxyacyl-ACP dehydratase FabZ [Alphaproteobacteria bacterium]